MADSKITALTSIGASTDPANDPLVLVDVSDTSMAASGTTKKVTLNQLLGASGTATLASATITGDLTVDTSTLKVDSANNRVGIGTATPDNQLSVRAASVATIDVRGGVGGAGALQISGNGTTLGTTSFDLIQNSLGALVYQRDALPLFFYVNGSERYAISSSGVATWSNVGGVAGTAMTLNSTGLGVGATPSDRLHLGPAGNIRLENTLGGTGTYSQIRVYNNTAPTNPAAAIRFIRDIAFYGNDGTICFDTRNVERLRIDNEGNVGVGVTPSAWNSAYRAIEIAKTGNAIFSNNASNNNILFTQNAYYDGAWKYGYTAFAAHYEIQNGAHKWYNAASGTAGGSISWTQAMTLDASGNLLVAKTANTLSAIGGVLQANGVIVSTLAGSTNSTDTLDVYSNGAAAYRFYVGMGGTVYATNTTISAISDARLKENVQDIDAGLGAILALKPRKFDWKAGKGKDIKGDRGFIAQEFEQVFPDLIDTWKDPAPEGEAPYKSVRQDLIPVLVKAIQELTARVEALEA